MNATPPVGAASLRVTVSLAFPPSAAVDAALTEKVFGSGRAPVTFTSMRYRVCFTPSSFPAASGSITTTSSSAAPPPGASATLPPEAWTFFSVRNGAVPRELAYTLAEPSHASHDGASDTLVVPVVPSAQP